MSILSFLNSFGDKEINPKMKEKEIKKKGKRGENYVFVVQLSYFRIDCQQQGQMSLSFSEFHFLFFLLETKRIFRKEKKRKGTQKYLIFSFLLPLASFLSPFGSPLAPISFFPFELGRKMN